jgi:glycosyl hydrolase family 95
MHGPEARVTIEVLMLRRVASLLVILCIACSCFAGAMVNVDYRALVSRADLDYDKPARRSEEGHPIGNGRMGSLVWTTPSALHFQINRVDVFAEDSYTVSFPKQDSDYASDCGYVDINVVSAGEDVFSGDKFNQHLSVYDAMDRVSGSGLTARVIASPQSDVMAVEIDDQRERPEPINVDLRMLRYAIQDITGKNYELAKNHTVEIRTAEHVAASKLGLLDEQIALTQKFTEGEHYSASAIVIGAVGRAAKARYLNESTAQLSIAPGKGQVTILIGSAASLNSSDDVTSTARSAVDAAVKAGFDELSKQARSWWHDFWSRGFVHMHSADGQADFVEANYTYFLYLMGSSSRGSYPPRFGGMLWYTNGDMRRWGSQYWWSNTSAYYANLMPANRLALMDPMFSMYSNMLDACALAAKQQWGSAGVWIPEITFFNGPEKLPDDIAAELQDLMLLRKPFDQRSQRFQWWAETKNRHNARWNFQDDGHYEHGHYVVPTKSAGIFGHCTHILSDAAKIGNLFYQRYLFTQDKDWLRDRAYPVVKGAAEFYRNFPNVEKGDDGKYHIRHINNGESAWDSSDAPNEIAGMKLAFSNAIRVATILEVDADLRAKWQDMLNNLAPPANVGRGRRPPQPTGGEAGTPGGAAPATQPDPNERGRMRNRPFGSFVYGGPGAIPANEPDAQQKSRFLGFDALGSFIDVPGIGGAQIFRNRLRLREGPGSIDAEHIAGLSMGIHSSLLNNLTDDPQRETIEAFTDVWPRSWDCAFQLLAHDGFLITSSLKDRQIQFVEVKSQLGGECRIKNPWPTTHVAIHRGDHSETTNGDVLKFDTAKDETILLVPAGASPQNQNQIPFTH